VIQRAPIRARPNIQARIISYAEQGDTFENSKEKQGWYKVWLSCKQTGWLPANAAIKISKPSSQLQIQIYKRLNHLIELYNRLKDSHAENKGIAPPPSFAFTDKEASITIRTIKKNKKLINIRLNVNVEGKKLFLPNADKFLFKWMLKETFSISKDIESVSMRLVFLEPKEEKKKERKKSRGIQLKRTTLESVGEQWLALEQTWNRLDYNSLDDLWQLTP